MADYPDSGVLFENDKRGDNAKAPNCKGKGNFNGVDFEIAAWVKVDKNGKKFLSLKFQAPRQQRQSEPEGNFPP